MNLSTSSSSSSSPSRKQQIHRLSTPYFCGGGGGSTAAEFCGGTTASCAALWCCGPCSVVNLVVLAVYKIPRGLCRRLRRRRLAKKQSKVGGSSQFAVHPMENKDKEDDDNKLATAIDLTEEEEEEDEAVIELEKEMWNRFYGGGFWRSYSQVENDIVSKIRLDS